MTKEAIDKLKYKHEDDIVKVGDESWNEATNATVEQLRGLKDTIFRAGYDLGLDSVGIPDDHKLYNMTILCLLGAFTTVVANPG